MNRNAFICTETTPWGKWVDDTSVLHPSAKVVPGSQQEGWPSGDIVTIKCPICGFEWERELPQ